MTKKILLPPDYLTPLCDPPSPEERDEIDALLKKFREDHEETLRGLKIQLGTNFEEALEESCTHEKVMPAYDHDEAVKINDAWEIKKRFPRFMGTCPTCGQQVICYASFEHYIMGDW